MKQIVLDFGPILRKILSGRVRLRKLAWPILLTRVVITEKQTGCQMAKDLQFAIDLDGYDFMAGVDDEISGMIFLAEEEISWMAGKGHEIGVLVVIENFSLQFLICRIWD